MPRKYPGRSQKYEPNTSDLDSGLELWRIHSEIYDANAFNPTIPDDKSGGRFDTLTGDYSYIYAGSDVNAAVAETLIRDRPPNRPYYRILKKRIRGKKLSKIRLKIDLKVVKLHGNGPSAVGQEDDWITSCGPKDYPITREWASAIREWSPFGCGIIYRPRHDNDRFAYVFFDDRCPFDPFEVLQSEPIDIPGPYFTMVQDVLRSYNAFLRL
jgi:hypothetical protein